MALWVRILLLTALLLPGSSYQLNLCANVDGGCCTSMMDVDEEAEPACPSCETHEEGDDREPDPGHDCDCCKVPIAIASLRHVSVSVAFRDFMPAAPPCALVGLTPAPDTPPPIG